MICQALEQVEKDLLAVVEACAEVGKVSHLTWVFLCRCFFFVKVILFKIWFASIFCWRELLEARLLCACRNSAVTSECRARERLWKRSWRRSEMPARPWLEHPFRQEIFAKVSRNRSICTKTYWVSMILLKFSSEFLSRNLLWITGWSLAAQGPLFDARRMMFRLKVPGLRVGKGETGLIA